MCLKYDDLRGDLRVGTLHMGYLLLYHLFFCWTELTEL